MIIKTGKFNFIFKDEGTMELYPIIDNRFNYFYMDGKEDTLYVNSRFYFDNVDKTDSIFEKELIKKFYVIDYTLLIRNLINRFIREKAYNLFVNNNYSRYDLYNEIDISKVENLERNAKYNDSFHTLISDSNKIMCNFEDGFKIYFDPYSEKLDNLEEIYKNGYFNSEIKANLTLLEIQQNKAPQFIMEILKINNFLKNKKNITLAFSDGNKIKKEALIYSFLDSYKNEIQVNVGNNYKIQDLKSIIFNKSELPISCENLMNLKNQIQTTAEDRLLFKIDDMKQELQEDFYNYQDGLKLEVTRFMPSLLESCIYQIKEIESKNLEIEQGNLEGEKIKYPEWYSEEFTDLWKKYEQIRELETACTIEDIKEVVQETGDNELQQIYYMFKGEEEEDGEEEEL